MPFRFLIAGFGAFCLSSAAQAQDEPEEDEPEELEELDEPERKSPREGTFFSVTLPVGLGAGQAGAGLAVGISGALGGGALSMPVYLVIADGGRSGGQYLIGLRYNAPKLFFIEALVGWVKSDPYYGASLGAGLGLGLDIPVYKRFTITTGATVSYAFAQSGFFGMGYAGPTMHF